ncbi:amidohydrolase, partial [Variovorax sp. 2RAF20]
MSTLVIRNARITTLDPQQPHAQALAVQNGRIVAVGSDEDIMRGWGSEATIVDAQGRRIVPGLNDSHT